MGEERKASSFRELARQKGDGSPDLEASSRIHSNLAAPVNAAVALRGPSDKSDTRGKRGQDVEIDERE